MDDDKQTEVNFKKAQPAFGVIALILIIYIIIRVSGNDSSKPKEQEALVPVATTETSEKVAAATTVVPTPKPISTFKLGEAVPAGKFAVTATTVRITTELKSDYTSEKTADQFVVVKVAVTNNDERARDVSTSMFDLVDANGKSYKSYDKKFGVSGDEFLFYETINPGLTRARSVAFETPKGISGLKLVIDSGVALAGGEKVMIDLGQ